MYTYTRRHIAAAIGLCALAIVRRAAVGRGCDLTATLLLRRASDVILHASLFLRVLETPSGRPYMRMVFPWYESLEYDSAVRVCNEMFSYIRPIQHTDKEISMLDEDASSSSSQQ